MARKSLKKFYRTRKRKISKYLHSYPLRGMLLVVLIFLVLAGSLATFAYSNGYIKSTEEKSTPGGTVPFDDGTTTQQDNSVPENNTNSKPSVGGGSNATTYTAPKCTKNPIPYKTTYESASWLTVGSTFVIGGENGYVETCTADSSGYKPPDLTIQPSDKIIYSGTYVPPDTSGNSTTQAQIEAARQQRIQDCLRYIGSRGAGGSSASQQCYSIQ